MDEHYYYLAVDMLCLSVPLLVSFSNYLPLKRHWREVLLAMLLTMCLFIPWDIWFCHEGIWSFNKSYTTGPGLFGLPLEEWLFFAAIPFACVFTYACFRKFLRKSISPGFTQGITILLLVISISTALFNIGKWYTFSSALMLFLLLLLHLKWKKEYLGHFYISFLIILVPFVISNGILTGLDFWKYPVINFSPETISDQIVKYNNLHNMQIRLWTIPMEDFYYGMLLLMLNVTWYEYFLSKSSRQRI